MINPQEKYFALLHTSQKTTYTEGRTLFFSDISSHFTADDFSAIEAGIKGNNAHWLGYISYDIKNSLEKLPAEEDFFLKLPPAWFGRFNNIKTFDDYKLPPVDNYQQPKVAYIESNMSKAEYLEKVAAIKQYIRAGDIYQANLTRKFYGEFSKAPDPYEIYTELNRLSPAPYSAFLRLGDTYIISSSPELFLRIDNDNNVITCPIKGSSGRGQTAQLQKSGKDISENLMITDLMRNDLARSCVAGSVKVEELFGVSEFSTISHMYSTIKGVVRADVSPLGAVRSCFPPGSMTGAPKIRAMEICSALEKHKRGVYSGVLGYINSDGATEFSVVIRTLIIQGNKFEFQVGGGIVHESEPEAEWRETMLKASAIADILGVTKEVRAL